MFPTPPAAAIDFVAVLKALADPARLTVVARLADGEYHPCSTEEYGLAIHKSTLSYHFKALREAGITSTLVSGREHAVRLRMDDLEGRFPGFISGVLAAAAHYEIAD
jgi:DNA-binding transcriptional ArsR family regulator